MRSDVFVILAVALAVLGIVRLLTTTDLVRRVIALNIASGGVLMVLVALAARTDPPDTVPHALVLTGIVITVSVTGLALVLIRRIEASAGASGQGPDGAAEPDEAPGASRERPSGSGRSEAGGGDR
ncbi:NADH-quinone oxidoreductase subunit K [Pseudactinotalea sp. Z1739]|uniref:NADH-quinone oxidoreductase subunit K n=1 Tax=Pseudactinotalea sp. Z1739 TaxID=3413028 RepID=UPI003C7B9D14